MSNAPYRRRRSWLWLPITLLVSLSAAVPVAYVTFPHVYRWRMIARVASDDLESRELGLRYVLTHAGRDEAVRRAAIARLDRLDDERFFQLAATLNLAGVWARPTVPDEAWFRWLSPLVGDANRESRILAAQRLADLSDLATDPRVVDRLKTLMGDADADVRLNALAAAAELAGAARFQQVDPAPLDALVTAATRDTEPRIARDAFIFVGLLDPASGVSANWQEAPPDVAMAIRWAATLDADSPPALPPDVPPDDPLALLFLLETQPVGERVVALTADMPPMVRLAAVAFTRDPDVRDLRPLFADEEPSMRDLACVVAAERFDREVVSDMAGELLRSYDDRDKMSGAMLCGLTGARPRAPVVDPATGQTLKEVDLLAYRLEHEDVWVVQQVLRLGLAMQGESVRDAEGRVLDIARLSDALLSMSQEVPLTTVLMAKLHLRDAGAWEYLLNPRGDERVDLLQLLDQQRWWRVLRRHVGEDGPGFSWWADPHVQRFQVEVLRNWYLVHRHRIRTEWGTATGSSTHGEAGQQ